MSSDVPLRSFLIGVLCRSVARLKQHGQERGLLFLSSPFPAEAVELLESLGVRAWKVASGETSYSC